MEKAKMTEFIPEAMAGDYLGWDGLRNITYLPHTSGLALIE